MIKRTVLLIGLAFLLISCVSCGESSNLNTDNVQSITLGIISSDEKAVNETVINEDDIDAIASILSNKEVYDDKGFVFAEGQYRIAMETEEGTVNLYPYCGNTSTIRVGDEGQSFIDLESEDEENLREVLNKYADIEGGIWDWSYVKGE